MCKSIRIAAALSRARSGRTTSTSSNLLLSFIYGERDENLNHLQPGIEGFDSATDRKNVQVDSQYIYEGEWFNFVAGFLYTNQNGLFEQPFQEPNPVDARSSFAVITTAGRQRFEASAPHYVGQIEKRFAAGLTDDELRTIARALRRVQTHSIATSPASR